MKIKTQMFMFQVSMDLFNGQLTLSPVSCLFSLPFIGLSIFILQGCLLTSAQRSLLSWCPNVALWCEIPWLKSTRSNSTRTRREIWKEMASAAISRFVSVIPEVTLNSSIIRNDVTVLFHVLLHFTVAAISFTRLTLRWKIHIVCLINLMVTLLNTVL